MAITPVITTRKLITDRESTAALIDSQQFLPDSAAHSRHA